MCYVLCVPPQLSLNMSETEVSLVLPSGVGAVLTTDPGAATVMFCQACFDTVIRTTNF